MTATEVSAANDLPTPSTRTRPPRVIAFLGPAFVASIAYVDPGNFATNFTAGAGYGYTLAWVIVVASLMGTFIQYLSSKIGIATGRSLPELCRDRFSRRTNLILWLQAEIVVLATDLAEFVGAAIGLNLVFRIPLGAAGLVTGIVAFAILALQQRGHRPFEIAVVALLALMFAGFTYLFLVAGHEHYGELAAGLAPTVNGQDSASLAVALVGATVMPHVVYLHSALHTRRIAAGGNPPPSVVLRYNRRDCALGLGCAALVNLSMLCIAAACLHTSKAPYHFGDLAAIHVQLGQRVGNAAALAFGLVLIVSGFASSSVGTYAGQVVMAGFTRIRLSLIVRRAITMLPSLVVLALVSQPGEALILSQIVLAFGVPFALVPLILVCRDRRLMGSMANRRTTTTVLALITLITIGLNAFLVGDELTSWV